MPLRARGDVGPGVWPQDVTGGRGVTPPGRLQGAAWSGRDRVTGKATVAGNRDAQEAILVSDYIN